MAKRVLHPAVAALTAALILSAPAFAQSATSPAPQRPATGDTVLQVSSKLVIVDVVVQDKSGNPVHGLKRDDFLISEAHTPQTLRGFDETVRLSTPAVIPPLPKLPAGTFTDYSPVPATGPLNILLIDGLNTPLADQSYLRSQLADYVKHLTPGTRIAIFGLSNHLYLLQGFTSDPRVLQAALGSIKSGQNSTLLTTSDSPTSNGALLDSLSDASAGDSALSSDSSALMTSSTQTFIEQIGVAQTSLRIQETIEAFNTLGHWLVNLRGRKNLIWFSGSFPLGVIPNTSIQNNTDIPTEDGEQFRAMTNLLTQAQVSVYPIDPRGLQVNSTFDVSNGARLTQPSFQSQLNAADSQRDAEHTTMQAIASDTGGQALYNRNDLTKAVGDAIDAGANYYTLAYSPSEHKTGGEWRSIQIALSPEAHGRGLQLSYRRGYFADNLKVASAKTGTAEVSIAAFTAQNITRNYARSAMVHGAPTPADILFTTRVLPRSTNDEDLLAPNNVVDPVKPMKPPFRRMVVQALAAPRYFTLKHESNGNYAGAIELAVFCYSAQGKLINTAARRLTINITPEVYANFQKTNVGLALDISVPSAAASYLRIGVQDIPSNRIGVVEIPTLPVLHLAPEN